MLEAELVGAIREMLQHPQFHFPLVAAQREYRAHYYGLSSAALLEDLYYDTFWNFLAVLSRHPIGAPAARGERGWDYSFQGQRVSHKVGLTPQPIAALWDATRTDVTHWTFDFSIAYLSAGYSPKQVVSALDRDVECNSAHWSPSASGPFATCGSHRAMGRERRCDDPSRCAARIGRAVAVVFGLDAVWGIVATETPAPDTPADNIDLVTSAQLQPLPWSACSPERLCVSTLV